MKKTCLLALAFVAACGDPPPPPKAADPPKPVVAPKPGPIEPPRVGSKAPPLTAAQEAEKQKALTASREKVKQAREFKKQGFEILKNKGPEAANDILVKAKDLFRAALAETEDWVEPEPGKVTEAQVKDYMQDVVNERATWTKEVAEMGKLHKN